MNTAKLVLFFGIALVAAFAALLIGTLIHSSNRIATTEEVRGSLEGNDPEKLRQWATDFVRCHPVGTNPLYMRRAERLTNAPLAAIKGRYPYVYTTKTEEADPVLVTVEWDRYGAKLLIGTTNFQSTNSEATLWNKGIYIFTRGTAEP